MPLLKEQLLILLSTPVYLILIVLEICLSNYYRRKWYNLKDAMVNILLMLANSLLDLLFRGAYLVILDYFYLRHWISFSSVLSYWFLLVLGEDFLYYWLHRFDHEIRFFWAVHVTHHSSEKMNFTVGFRSSVFQPLYRFVYFIPLALLGFRPLDILFVYAATQIWGILVHTELVDKLGWLEYLLVTPSHHRVHHASNPKYLDKNMGMLLIIWDQLFGTFQPELPDEMYQKKKYGLTKPHAHSRPTGFLFDEWKQIYKDISRPNLHWKERLGYVFGPPGWSHDGSRLTSNELRDAEAVENLAVFGG